MIESGSLVQAAVNVSIVQGTLTAERAKAMSSRGRGIDPDGGQAYSAAALSLVYHPAHPFVPTLRADVRRFQVSAWLSVSAREVDENLCAALQTASLAM